MRPKWVQSTFEFLFTAGLVFLLCEYVADFPLRQSAVLALLVGAILYALRQNANKPLVRFSPYDVFIRPTWSRLLIDYKLVANPEDWQFIELSLSKQPTSTQSVLRDVVHFTVVQQSDDFERTLIYWHHDNSFASEVEFEQYLPQISAKREVLDPILGDYDFYFFARWGTDGYNLGLVVSDSWWHSKKTLCPKPLTEIKRHLTGQVELVLATIPYREFDVYWQSVQWDSTYNETVSKRRDGYRSKFAWAAMEQDDDPELALDPPNVLYHKYFELQHRAV